MTEDRTLVTVDRGAAAGTRRVAGTRRRHAATASGAAGRDGADSRSAGRGGGEIGRSRGIRLLHATAAATHEFATKAGSAGVPERGATESMHQLHGRVPTPVGAGGRN